MTGKFVIALVSSVVLVALLILLIGRAPLKPYSPPGGGADESKKPDQESGLSSEAEHEAAFKKQAVKNEEGPPKEPKRVQAKTPKLIVTVYGREQKALKGASVTVRKLYNGGRVKTEGKTETNAEGKAVFASLESGPFSVVVKAPGYAYFQDRLQPLAADEILNYDVHLVSSDREHLELLVVDSSDMKSPISGARCEFESEVGAHGVTDDQGAIVLPVPECEAEGLFFSDDAGYRIEYMKSQGFVIPERTESGFFFLKIRAKGYQGFQDLFVVEEIPEEPVIVELAQGSGFRGRFVDSHGQLIPDVRYEFLDSRGSWFRGVHYAKDGRFALFGMRNGDEIWRLKARKRGYQAVEIKGLRASPKGTAVRVVMKKGHSVVVRVVDTDGAAVKGAEAEVWFQLAGSAYCESARSGPNGECKVRNLPPGQYILEVSRDGYFPAERSVNVPAKETVVISLDRGHFLTVKVLSEDKEPVSKALVRAGKPDRGPMEPYLRTSGDGIAEFGGFAEPATCTFTVEKEGYLKETVEGKTGEEVTVVLKQGSTVTFRILPRDLNLPTTARVRLHLKERSQYRPEDDHRLTIEDGSITVMGLPPGKYDMELHVPGFAKEGFEDLDIGPHENIEIEVELSRGGTLKGYVFDDETGRPAIGARVKVSLRGGVDEYEETDSKGFYMFEHLHGRIHGCVSQDDRCTEDLGEIMVSGGDVVRVPTVYLKKGTTIVARFRNLPEDAHRISLHLSWRKSDGYFRGRGSVAPLSKVARLKNFKPGTYNMSVEAGEKELERKVTIEEGQREIETVFDFGSDTKGPEDRQNILPENR